MWSRNLLGWLLLLPSAVLLLGLLAYPLGLGVWLGFTDAKIGSAGEWVGFENFSYLITDEVVQLALFNTLFYTTVASALKFGSSPSFMNWSVSFGSWPSSPTTINRLIEALGFFGSMISRHSARNGQARTVAKTASTVVTSTNAEDMSAKPAPGPM